MLAKLLNICVKESYYLDFGKVSSVIPVLKNIWERSSVKNDRPASLLSVVSKIFKTLVNNRFVDHLEKCGLFQISSMVAGLAVQL